jgi:hypothetical protein
MTYTLNSNGTISFEFVYAKSAGWFSVGFNDDGIMVPCEAILAFVHRNETKMVGTIYVNSYLENDIMSTYDSFDWQLSGVSFTPTAENTTLRFTRPMEVAASNRSSCISLAPKTSSGTLTLTL